MRVEVGGTQPFAAGIDTGDPWGSIASDIKGLHIPEQGSIPKAAEEVIECPDTRRITRLKAT